MKKPLFEYSKHIKMWEWLASQADNICNDKDNTVGNDVVHKYKKKWFIREKEPLVKYLCYACDYCDDECKDCPLEETDCLNTGLYAGAYKLLDKKDTASLRELFHKLAHLKVKEGVKYV